MDVDTQRRVLWFWATAATVLNASMALWLVSSAATTGLPFGDGSSPEIMRTGAGLLAAALVTGAAGAFIAARDIPYLPSIDDDTALSLLCQSLPPLVTLVYAALI